MYRIFQPGLLDTFSNCSNLIIKNESKIFKSVLVGLIRNPSYKAGGGLIPPVSTGGLFRNLNGWF